MKRGLILYPKSTTNSLSNAFSWLKQEASCFDIQLDILFFEEIELVYGPNYYLTVSGNQLNQVDFVVMRGYHELISLHFELQGIPVINSYASMQLSHNKMLTHQTLTINNIPTPKSIFTQNANYLDLCKEFQNQQFVVKQIDGSKGENVFLVHSEEEFDKAISKIGSSCMFQQYISTSFGRDIRVWVIGNRIAGCVLRQSDTSFLSNYSQGGKALHFDINQEVAELALRSTHALGLEFAGVDILFDQVGYSVCEVNGNAGFRSISSISDENIPYQLFEYINKRVYGFG